MMNHHWLRIRELRTHYSIALFQPVRIIEHLFANVKKFFHLNAIFTFRAKIQQLTAMSNIKAILFVFWGSHVPKPHIAEDCESVLI